MIKASSIYFFEQVKHLVFVSNHIIIFHKSQIKLI